MLKYFRNQKAQSTFEYIVLITFILAAFLVFQKYIARAFYGRWRDVGDGLGQGRIYDPNISVECAYDGQYTGRWYEVTCFENNCTDDCLKIIVPSACSTCIQGCFNPKCD